MDRSEEIREAGAKLGINTTGELLDPRFDYVFKRIFTAQEEESKIALIDFLNSVLTGKHETIVDLTVVNNEIPVEAYKGLCKNKLYKYEKKCYTMKYG